MGETHDLTGVQLGSYRVLNLIGRGGMADVYRGYDSNLQRPVAIKILAPATAAMPGFVARFRQEALMIARLHHPHIVQVYNFGVQDDIVYMVQELLPGPTLATYMQQLARQGQWASRQDVLAIAAQLAQALDAAHAAGIVHRDVKPANALWNSAGALVLTDFGVARPSSHQTAAARPSYVMGTPHYLSPEQGRGLPGEPASDIYALGVVIYELLSGSVPFHAPTRDEVIRQHISRVPPIFTDVRPDLPVNVTEVLWRALEKEPAHRYKTATAFAHELRRAWPPLALAAPPRALPTDPPSDVPDVAVAAAIPNGQRYQSHIHNQTTVITPLPHAARLRARPSAPPPPDDAAKRRPRKGTAQAQGMGSALSGMLVTLLVALVVGAGLYAVYEEYRTAPIVVEFAPTAIPTALIIRSTPAAVAAAEPNSEPGDATGDVVDAPTSPPVPEIVAAPAAPTPTLPPPAEPTPAPTDTPAARFVRLRDLLQQPAVVSESAIDPQAWSDRVTAIEQAIAAGDTGQATRWLGEVRQMIVYNSERGSMPPDAAREMLDVIEGINRDFNLGLPATGATQVADTAPRN